MQLYVPSDSAAESKLFRDWETEVDGHKIWSYNRVSRMRERAAESSNALMREVPGIWNRTVLSEPQYEFVNRKHDCSYQASFVSLQTPTNVPASTGDKATHKIPSPTKGDEFEVLFRIRQFDCVSGCHVLGGASFQVFTRIGIFMHRQLRMNPSPDSNNGGDSLLMYQLSQSIVSNCYVDDHFNNDYTVRCGFNVHSLLPYDMSNAMYCLNTSFVLDYEHFDAFSEVRMHHLDMLRLRVPVSKHPESIVEIVNTDSGNGNLRRRYKMIQLPIDAYSNYVTCFEPVSGGSSNQNIARTRLLQSNQSFQPHYSSYGVWREVFTAPSAPIQLTVPDRLSPSLDRVFGLHRQYLVDRAAMAAINPADLYYCGNTSLVDTSGSTKQMRKIAVASSSLDSLDAFNNNEHGVSSAFTFERKREFSQWTGIGNKLVSSEKILKASANNQVDLVLLGESHMRYMWDYIARVYFFQKGDFSVLSQKHLDVTFIREVIFLHRLFIPAASDGLDHVTEVTTKYFQGVNGYNLNEIDIPTFRYKWYSNATIKTVAIQFGAWDLDTYPVRGAMDSPNRGLHRFMSALQYNVDLREKQVKEDETKGYDGAKSTVGPMHLIIVSMFPHYPKYNHNVTGGWKNNFAIRALNQKLFQVLLQYLDPKREHGTYSLHKLLTTFNLPQARMKITLFNAYEMMIQTAEFDSGVCGDHSLCHVGSADDVSGGYTRLRSGLVSMNVLLFAAFDSLLLPDAYDKEGFNTNAASLLNLESVTAEKRKDKNIDIDKVSTQERLDELFVEHSSEFRESTISCVKQPEGVSPYKECYLIISGMKQLFPDEETLLYAIRTRLEQCLSQTMFVPMSASQAPSASLKNALINESAIICDNMVGFGAIDFSKAKEDLSHISSLFTMFSTKPPLFNHSAHSYCLMPASDADIKETYGMCVQDGRKHKVILTGEIRDYLKFCSPDEIMPEGEPCSPNPLVNTNGQLVHCPPSTKKFYMRNGKKEYILPFYLKYNGWKEEGFIAIDNFELFKVIEMGDTFYQPPFPPPDGMVLLVYNGLEYFLMKNGTRHLVSKDLFSHFRLDTKSGAGHVSPEYMESIPLGRPMTIED
jgi:hypothetical protein